MEQADPGKNPGDYRVGVPHLARTKLITAPNGRGNRWHQGERPRDGFGVGREMNWAVDRAGKVGNDASSPAPDLVAEEPEVSCGSAADRTFGNDSSLGPLPRVADGGHLDHGRITIDDRYQCRVIQVMSRTVLHQGRHSLVRPAARAYDVGTCTQRNPVQIERCRSVTAEGRSPLHRCPRRTCHKNDCDESLRDAVRDVVRGRQGPSS